MISLHHRLMRRAYRYRLTPTRAQEAALRETLARQCELYNAALQERRDAWRKGVRVTSVTQQRQIKDVRKLRPEYADIHAHLLKDAIVRVDRAFKAFFRRCKVGETPGYPRFRARSRYRTMTFSDARNGNGLRIVAGGKRIDVAKIGKIKVRMHRPIEGTLKQASITLSGDGHWYVSFSCADVPPKPLPATGQSTGIDVGITSFAVLEDGERIDSPRVYQREAARLARAQRIVARRRKGSARRRKAVAQLRKQHDRITRVRRDFHHKTACYLVRRFDTLKIEDLNVLGLARSRLAKHVLDAGWAQFASILADKAESAGRELIKVDPRGTSQECSACGRIVSKTLAERVHSCPCGLVMDRDQNAARNIGKRLRHSRQGGRAVGLPDDLRSAL